MKIYRYEMRDSTGYFGNKKAMIDHEKRQHPEDLVLKWEPVDAVEECRYLTEQLKYALDFIQKLKATVDGEGYDGPQYPEYMEPLCYLEEMIRGFKSLKELEE